MNQSLGNGPVGDHVCTATAIDAKDIFASLIVAQKTLTRNDVCKILWNATLPTPGEPMHEYIPRAADMLMAELQLVAGVAPVLPGHPVPDDGRQELTRQMGKRLGHLGRYAR